MSLEANIDIHFEHLSFKKVIDLLSSDWKIDYHGHIEYMDNENILSVVININRKK